VPDPDVRDPTHLIGGDRHALAVAISEAYSPGALMMRAHGT